MGCGILALILSLSLSMPFPSYASGKFRDTAGHWAEGYVTRAYHKNFVDGYPDGRFLPDKSVTRAEFAAMVNKAFDIQVDTNAINFKDVSYSKWYYQDVAKAITATYAGGYSDKTFRPNQPVTRQEAAVMLSKILPNYKEGGNLKSFRDYRLIASWAVSAMEKMTGRGYLGAYNDGRLHPNDPITRAQTAKILCEILDNETIVTRNTVIDEDKTTLSERIYTNDVRIDEDLEEGSAAIDNCVILGTLTIEGGGAQSININNSRIANVIVDKQDRPVRIVTKGETTISKLSAWEKSILQTAGKDSFGILDITVNKGADLTLKGNFPVVNIAGSAAVVALESGKITNLTVAGGGKYSDITLTGKAQIAEATVNAEAYFHGEGVITHMSVNADDITYETKPKKMTVAVTVDRATEEGDSDVDVTFKPKSKSTGVAVDENIIITFTSSMKLVNGSAISDKNIKDFISLREGSKGGSEVEFTGSVNSARKVITLTPKSDLSISTRYYVTLQEEALINAGGTKNEGMYMYFTTNSKGGSTSVTFSPANGTAGVSASASPTIRFVEDVVKYSDGGAVTAAYLQECVQLKSGSAAGSNVSFTASISSSDTITITPGISLTAGQVYYVGIAADKLKTKDGGKTIPAASATWTVASATPTPAAATLTTLTVAPAGGSNRLTGFSSTTASYHVTLPFGTANIDISATAASGTAIQINGIATSSAVNIPIPSDSITAINASAAASGCTTTNYTVDVQVAGITSLSALSIDGIALLTGPDIYSANVTATATFAAISVTTMDPNAAISMGGASGSGSLTTNVNLPAGNQSIPFTVTSNMTTKTYSIQFSRLAP